jgi:hypothetical protein
MGLLDGFLSGNAEQRARNEAATQAAKNAVANPATGVREALLKMGYRGPGADKLKAGAEAAAQAAAGQSQIPGATEAFGVVGQMQDGELRRKVLAEANRMAVQSEAAKAADGIDNALAQNLMRSGQSDAQIADILSSAFAKVSVEEQIAKGAIKDAGEAEQLAGGLRNAFADAAMALKAAPK